MAVGSASSSANSVSTWAAGLILSYRCQRRLRSRQNSVHAACVDEKRRRAIGKRDHSRPEVGAPRRTALNDRDRGALDLDLEADLVRGVRRHASIDEPPDPCEVELGELRTGGHAARLPSNSLCREMKRGRFRYALYRSYVLLVQPPIEPISHPIRAWLPLGKAQRIEEVTYDPLLYLARRHRSARLS
jgi:hypothetical protein